MRFGLALLALVSGYICLNQTKGYLLRDSDPARAYALSPRDGRVAAAFAQKLLQAGASTRNVTRARAIAEAAVLRDPTAVVAVYTLGVAAQLNGEMTSARRLSSYAEALSRRDLPTQLWIIENAVARGDVPGALRHYDIALRTSSNASDLLFPILVSAITDPAIRTALTRTLSEKPEWSALFVEYAAANSPAPEATAQLFQDLHRAGIPVSGLSQMLLIDALASRGQLNEAWSYYRSLHPGINVQRSRDPAFAASPSDPTLFDWRMSPTEGVTGSIQRQDDHGILDFTGVSGVGGPVAQQVQMLSPGQYRLVGISAELEQTEAAAQPYWALSCRGGRELGRVVVPGSAQAQGHFTGHLEVPRDCPVQVLSLITRPSDAVSGSSGQFRYIQLVPESD